MRQGGHVVNGQLALALATDLEAPFVTDQLRARHAPSLPELQLMQAILEQTAYDLARYYGADDLIGARTYRDAWKWTRSNDRAYPFTFVNVCELLGLEPDAVRREMLRVPAVASAA